MAGPSGTFIGHLIPGLVFTIWGVWWLWELAGSGRPREVGEPVERTLFPTSLKILAVLIAFPLEIPNAGWEPMDWVMGWHHITGYIGFGLSGVVDLLARRGLLTSRATYLALAGAAFNGAILFYGHGNSLGVEGSAHDILMMMFFAVGIFCLLETAAPSWRLEWFRIGSMIGLGCWLTITSWLLFRSGWDLTDHVREGHVWLRFSWMIMTVAAITTAASIRVHRRTAMGVVVLLVLGTSACQSDFDLVLEGGTVIDGSGAPGVMADVGVLDGRITEVGDLSGRSAAERVDASGHVVAPGFIDPHTHSRGTIFEIPTADNFVLQGVTTLVEGNDGSSPLDMAQWYDSLTARGGTGPNFAMFVGHGTIRSEVLGSDDRAPSEAELDRMRGLVEEAMVDGALGLSTGLFYLPGSFATTEEAIELSRVAAEYGGIYISHMRNEGDRVFESIEETIRIGREADIPVQMTHHKIGAWRNFGRAPESIAMMEAARAAGIDITFDQYPYTASSTSLSAIIPRWAQEGDRLPERLADAATRERIVDDMVEWIEMRFASDPSKIQLVSCSFDEETAKAFPAEMAGITLADILAARDVEGEVVTADLILEIDQAGGCGAIFHSFDETDVQTLMQSEFGMIGSDGSLAHFGRASPHPRGYGTFPRVLGHYARDLGVLSLEEAVRRMTSAPADRLGFDERGRIETGMVADLVVFDPETVIDRATFDDPHQYPVGIPHVFVAGQAVVRAGKVTGERPGAILRGPGYRNQ